MVTLEEMDSLRKLGRIVCKPIFWEATQLVKTLASGVSGRVLGTMPVHEEDVQAAIGFLLSLFGKYGPPGVIRMG